MMHHEDMDVFGPVRSCRHASAGVSGSARITRARPVAPVFSRVASGFAMPGILLCIAAGGCNQSFFAKPGPAAAQAPPADSWDSQVQPPAKPAEGSDDVMSEVDRFIASLQDARSDASGSSSPDPSNEHKPDQAAAHATPGRHESSAGGVAAEPGGERKVIANASLSAEGPEVERGDGHGSQTDPPSGAPAALPIVLAISVEEEPASVTRATPTQTGLANAPADAAPAENKLSVEEYLTALQQGETQLDPVEAAWRARLLEITLGRPSQNSSRVDRLTPSQQDVLDASLDAVRAVRRVLRDPVASACEALEDVDRLHAALQEMSDLTIPRTALCGRVMTFGVYEPMPSDRFVAGRVNQTILYCEVRNFVSHEENGEFRSKFSGRAELLTPSGDSVWKQEEPSIEDRCTSRRTDFFIAQRISFPATIPAGEYLLKVTLEDKLAGKFNETTLPLTVRSASSLATTKEP
ncbi:MAG: hypothetical protein IT449_04475 [Phycisphaerales bacterium]|nr:hypothetical protein [Phycisphaerales bacterium]